MGLSVLGGGATDRKIARDLPFLRGLPHRDEEANPENPGTADQARRLIIEWVADL
jgi:hypothetical protein